MWILLKLAAAVFGFALRLYGRRFSLSSGNVQTREGVPLRVRLHTNKGTVYWTDVTAQVVLPCAFKLTREKWYDLLFKRIGLSVEIQSGDRGFDEWVYIACDHPDFARLMQLDPETRALILRLMPKECRFLLSDGKTLTARWSGGHAQDEDLLRNVARLARRLAGTGFQRASIFSDSFARRALAVEAVIWSLAGYAIAGLIEWFTRAQDIHLDSDELIVHGLSWGGALGLTLLAAIAILLGRSSRGHRILIESFVVIVLSIPAGGIHLINDLNKELDSSVPVVVRAPVEDVIEKVSQGRRGRKIHSYYLRLGRPDSSEFPIPNRLQVTREIYSKTRAGETVPLVVRRGWLGHPWLTAVNGVEY